MGFFSFWVPALWESAVYVWRGVRHHRRIWAWGPQGWGVFSELLFQTLRFPGLMESPSHLWSGHRACDIKPYRLLQELKKCHFMIVRMSVNNEIGAIPRMKLPKKKKKSASSRKMTSKAFHPEMYKGSLKSHPRRLHREFYHTQCDIQMYLNIK